MSLIKFRTSWRDDDTIYRDIEILSGSTYFELHTTIKQAWQFPADMEASMYVSNNQWKKERQIDSTVEKNLRDAAALSMKKTPIGALVVDPHQKFLYECVHPKAWVLLIELLTLDEEPMRIDLYPRCSRTEGISPTQLGVVPTQKDSVMEIEERYDLHKDEEGFGDEGEEGESDSDTEESFGEDFAEEI